MQWRRGVALAALVMGTATGLALNAQAGPVSITPKSGSRAPVTVKMGKPQTNPALQNAPNPLGLSDAQKSRLMAIDKSAQAQLQAIIKSKASDQDKRKKAMALSQKVGAQRMAVLTPAQRSKVTTAVARQQAAMRKQAVKLDSLKKSLTPQQKAKMDQLNKEMAAKARAIQADKTLSNQQKQQKFMVLQMDARARVGNILTAKQKAMLK